MNINWFKNNYIRFCSFNANVFVFAHFYSYNFCIFSFDILYDILFDILTCIFYFNIFNIYIYIYIYILYILIC